MRVVACHSHRPNNVKLNRRTFSIRVVAWHSHRPNNVKLNRRTFSIRVVACHSHRPNNVKLISTRSFGCCHFDFGDVCRGSLAFGDVCRGSLAFGNTLKRGREFQGKCSCIHITVPVGVFNLQHVTKFMQTTTSV
jgi:hypothetical protein